MAENSLLPDKPDYNKIEAMLFNLINEWHNSNKEVYNVK